MEPNESPSVSPAWSCKKCGQENSSAEKYCKKCGVPNVEPASAGVGVNPSNEAEGKIKPKSKKKTWVWIVVALAVLIGVGIAGYYAYDMQRKKVAKAYLISQASAFSDSVKAINVLMTEKRMMMADYDDNAEILVKELEKEKEKVTEALDKTVKAKNDETGAGKNDLVGGTSSLLADYYVEAEKNLSEYKDYIAYEIAINKAYLVFQKEAEKVANDSQAISSLDELKNLFVALKEVVDNSINEIKAINPPEGLKEVHAKEVVELEKFSSILGEIVLAIETLDDVKFEQADMALGAYLSDDTAYNEIEDLKDYYFDELNKKFEDNRKKADKIKENLTMEKTTYQITIVEIEIENW